MKASEILASLTTLEFEATYVASTPTLLRELLLRSDTVRNLRQLYASGSVSDVEISAFVSGLLREGIALDRFPYQHALAAIAVMLEGSYTPFARKFLADLGRIRTSSFAMCAGVGRKCITIRQRGSTSNIVGLDTVAPAELTTSVLITTSPTRQESCISSPEARLYTDSESLDNVSGWPAAA